MFKSTELFTPEEVGLLGVTLLYALHQREDDKVRFMLMLDVVQSEGLRALMTKIGAILKEANDEYRNG